MTDSGHHKASASSISYSVRRMRNTAVLVKWIEDHQSNPYPTKAEKQYLAYYSGMNLTQLSTWFANARRRIKKIGMKTWLEGRSTFSLDTSYFPSSIQTRADYSGGSSYPGLTATSPYAAAAYSPLATGLHSSYPSHQHSSLSMGSSSHITNGLSSYDGSLQPSSSSTSPMGAGIYGMSTNARSSVMGLGMSTLPMANWPSTPILSSTPVSFPSLQSRPSSGNAAPLHSPLTAQVYTADGTSGLQLRTHSSQNLDVGDTSYSLQHQQSPDQMLPECASSEPILTDHSHKSTAMQN